MSLKTNPFIGFHSNFDLESGDLTEPGWPNKEILLIRVTDNIEKAKNTRIKVCCESSKTTILEDQNVSLEIEGDLSDVKDEGVEFNEVIIEVPSIDDLIASSKAFFSKTMGEFNELDSPLSEWFDYKKRKKVLMDNAFEKMISDGLYNHLIPIIYTPFTKELFQRGELNSDSPDMFTGILKRKLKIQ